MKNILRLKRRFAGMPLLALASNLSVDEQGLRELPKSFPATLFLDARFHTHWKS
jgi:hypothetical protein